MNLESPIEPTVGRIVLVRGPVTTLDYEVPAIVTRVWSRNCINVAVFADSAGLIPITSVAFSDPEGEVEVGSVYAAWRWMPYQVAKAAEEAAPVVALDTLAASPTAAPAGTFYGEDLMGIGDAVDTMRAGLKVARLGWNGKGMWLYLVPANSYPAQTEAAKAEFGEVVPYREYVAMKTAQGDVVPWLASQSDLLANDWVVVA